MLLKNPHPSFSALAHTPMACLLLSVCTGDKIQPPVPTCCLQCCQQISGSCLGSQMPL